MVVSGSADRQRMFYLGTRVGPNIPLRHTALRRFIVIFKSNRISINVRRKNSLDACSGGSVKGMLEDHTSGTFRPMEFEDEEKVFCQYYSIVAIMNQHISQ